MKKNLKKLLAGLFTVILACTAFVGCSKNSSGYSGETITVQVNEINGSEVTAQVGTMEEISRDDIQNNADMTPPSGMPQGGDGTVPGGMPNNVSGDGAFPSGMPDNISGGAMQPDGNGRRPSSFTAGEDSVSFTLSDDITITVADMNGETEGSTEDITEGSVLEVTYDDNGQVSSILVQNPRGGRGGRGGNNGTNSNDSQSNKQDQLEDGTGSTT